MSTVTVKVELGDDFFDQIEEAVRRGMQPKEEKKEEKIKLDDLRKIVNVIIDEKGQKGKEAILNQFGAYQVKNLSQLQEKDWPAMKILLENIASG